MGYRSSVAAVLYVTDKTRMPELKLWLTENFPIEEFGEDIRWFDRGIVLECDDNKWYDSIPNVKKFNAAAQAFIDMFCVMDEEVFGGAYEFMRIGEDYEDIESLSEGDCEYFLECNRSIRIDI
jgi:hypothetical protein